MLIGACITPESPPPAAPPPPRQEICENYYPNLRVLTMRSMLGAVRSWVADKGRIGTAFTFCDHLAELDLRRSIHLPPPPSPVGCTTCPPGSYAPPVKLFAGLSRLRSLNLDSNRIADLPVGIFGSTPGLQDLSLWSNGLTRTATFTHFPFN